MIKQELRMSWPMAPMSRASVENDVRHAWRKVPVLEVQNFRVEILTLRSRAREATNSEISDSSQPLARMPILTGFGNRPALISS